MLGVTQEGDLEIHGPKGGDLHVATNICWELRVNTGLPRELRCICVGSHITIVANMIIRAATV